LSDYEKLGIVVKYEFLKHIRRKRLYVIFGIALLVEALVLILIPILRDGYPQDTISLLGVTTSGVMTMAAMLTIGPSLAAIGAVFFAGDAIAGEYEGKTGFLLFINPIKRYLLWIGKYLAGFIAVTLLIVFSYIIIAIALAVIYHQVPLEIFESFGLCVFYAAAVLSVTFLFSAISKGSMGATVMTLLFVWVVCGIVESVLAYTGNPYWFILSAGGDSIALPYGSLQQMMAGLGMGGERMQDMISGWQPLTTGMASWGMLIYFVGGLLGSLWISRRRQLA
jgi:ABC-type transport system involved in multi-copper enzyme maturation permease subunit